MKHGARFDRLAVILGAAALLGMAGAAGAQDNGEYGVLMKTLANPFWGAMSQGVEDGPRRPASNISCRRPRATRRPSRSSTFATPCSSASRRR